MDINVIDITDLIKGEEATRIIPTGWLREQQIVYAIDWRTKQIQAK